MTDASTEMAQSPSPVETRDPFVRQEVKRAAIWLGGAVLVGLVVLLNRPLLIIFGGVVVAIMLDGGVRLLGRVLKIGHAWRLLIIVAAVAAFLIGTVYMTGVQIADQFAQLRKTLEGQAALLSHWLTSHGLMPHTSDLDGLVKQGLGSVGRVTAWVGTAVGAVTTIGMIVVLGIFLSVEPRVYERGMLWFVPTDQRPEFARAMDRIGYTMRRLMAGRLVGMVIEGTLTAIALGLGHVPMALLLGIIAGTLAFIPNVGAIITGILMVSVGFSAGDHTGWWAVGTYAMVQIVDGYIVVPTVARRTVNLPPALTLSAQILASALFGILGLALADPLTAMAKAALEERSDREKQLDEQAVE